jgi:hypothetical protein
MVHIIHQVQVVVARIVIFQAARMETRHCHGCNQVGHLLRSCPNAAKAPNPTINNTFVGIIDLSNQMETIMDHSNTAKSDTTELWTHIESKKEVFEEYLRALMSINKNWKEVPI